MVLKEIREIVLLFSLVMMVNEFHMDLYVFSFLKMNYFLFRFCVYENKKTITLLKLTFKCLPPTTFTAEVT